MPLFTLWGRPERPASRRRTVLSVLTLDDRIVPNTTMTSDPLPPAPLAKEGETAAPADFQITEFTAHEIATGMYAFCGRVSGENVAGLTITLGGVPSCEGVTCTVNSDGTFEVAVRVQTDGSDTGTVWAVASDGNGNESNVASVFINPLP